MIGGVEAEEGVCGGGAEAENGDANFDFDGD